LGSRCLGEQHRRRLKCAVGRDGRLRPHHDCGMPSVELVAEAAARGGGVDRGAVEDQSDGLGATRERTANDLFAFTLGLR
jgi:hypothetical protein